MGGQPGRISMANILINTGIKVIGRVELAVLRKIQGRELVSLGSNPMLLRGETSSCL